MSFSDKLKRLGQWLENSLFQFGWVIAVCGFAVGIYIFFWPLKFGIESLSQDNRGDLIGGVVGSLLSFSGILLLVRAIWDQKESIKISKEGLDNQSKEFEINRRILQEQQFGAIFFQLLGAYGELLKSFETKTPLGDDVSGKKCLEYLHETFVRKCSKLQTREEILEKYRELVKEHKLTLKQFNQSLEMVLSYLLRFDPEQNKTLQQKYAGFISAQLSYYEEFFLLLYLFENPKFSRAEIQALEMFDFDAEPQFEFLCEFNAQKSSR